MASSGEWRRETDASTGRAYFWHPTTGEARWTLDASESERLKHTSRFWGVSWFLRTSRWLVRYDDDSKPRRKKCYVDYFDNEERAALAYNKAIIEADLEHLRVMNRVDASGRPLPKNQD